MHFSELNIVFVDPAAVKCNHPKVANISPVWVQRACPSLSELCVGLPAGLILPSGLPRVSQTSPFNNLDGAATAEDDQSLLSSVHSFALSARDFDAALRLGCVIGLSPHRTLVPWPWLVGTET